jgi:hypothetical protein
MHRDQHGHARAVHLGVPGTGLAVAGAWLLSAAHVLAASPAPSPGSIGDPRSSGQGPGFVGDPLAAIAIVALVAVLSLVATLAWVRATGGPRDDTTRR